VTRAQSAKVTPARTKQFLRSAAHSGNVDDLAQNDRATDSVKSCHGAPHVGSGLAARAAACAVSFSYINTKSLRASWHCAHESCRSFFAANALMLAGFHGSNRPKSSAQF
jgi:hypothetical protein